MMTSSEPIPPAVLKRKAVVYVRQSRANDANMTWSRLLASVGSRMWT